MAEKLNKVLEKEISQDEAYQRSGHPILTVSPFVRELLLRMYEHQLHMATPYSSRRIKRDA